MSEINQITEDNFEEIFKRYFGPLCNYVNAQIKDWESSREIVQGAFLKIWESRGSIEINTSVKSYLYSTCRNRMIDWIRANKRTEEINPEIMSGVADEVETEINPYLIRSEILNSMAKLKPKVQKIFSLSKIEGLTYGEIASYLNISKRTVEDNVAKAIAHLREDLRHNEYLFD